MASWQPHLGDAKTSLTQNDNLTCSSTSVLEVVTCLPIGPMFLVWPVSPFDRIENSCPSLPSDAPSDGLQRMVLAALERSRWRQGARQTQPQILQRTTGWDGCGPFLSEGLWCITWNTRGLVGSVFSRVKRREYKLAYLKNLDDRNNIICLQKVHGKDEFFQAIQDISSGQ